MLGLALEELGRQGLFRVVLIHHPPLAGQAGWRRGLRDAKELTSLLKEKGAELVLHGHNHEQTLFELETVTGPAIVVGVPSASEAVSGRIPAARYNEYRIGKVEQWLALRDGRPRRRRLQHPCLGMRAACAAGVVSSKAW